MKVITALQFGRQLGEPALVMTNVSDIIESASLTIGMDPAPSRQILKRLEDEGLVRYLCPVSVPLGL